MGTRYTANTEEPTTLRFQFVKNGVPTDPYLMEKITIHASRADADADTNILQTILTVDITALSNSTFSYIVDLLTTAATYYDKAFVVPIEDADTLSFVDSFNVIGPIYTSGVTGGPGTCIITGLLVDHNAEPIISGRVYAMPISSTVIDRYGIYVFPTEAHTTSTGSFSIELIRGMEFNIVIKEIGLAKTILIPDQESCELWSLIGVETQEEVAAELPPPGDDTWWD